MVLGVWYRVWFMGKMWEGERSWKNACFSGTPADGSRSPGTCVCSVVGEGQFSSVPEMFLEHLLCAKPLLFSRTVALPLPCLYSPQLSADPNLASELPWYWEWHSEGSRYPAAHYRTRQSRTRSLPLLERVSFCFIQAQREKKEHVVSEMWVLVRVAIKEHEKHVILENL